MNFEDSPDLEQYKDGLPEPPSDPQARRKRFRVVLLIALLFVLVLGAVNFMGSPTASLLSGTGAVTGIVVGQDGKPFQGEIFILGTDLETSTDADGHFALERVPAGPQSLIVADDVLGREFPIEVNPGQTVNLGQIQFVPTATP